MQYPHPPPHFRKAGFTLIEISVVLVIVGLIISGIFVGRAMIEDAQIRKVVSESEKLETAINTFKIKYGCLPGDCINWASFGFSNAVNGWNGNGNGIINTPVSTTGEPFATFTHLAEAGLTPNIYLVVPIDKRPKSMYAPPGDWWIWYRPEIVIGSGGGNSAIDFPSHFFALTGCLYACAVPFIKPSTALQIDTKMDNGLPLTGKVRSYYADPYGSYWYGVDQGISCYDTTKTPFQYRVASTTYDCIVAIGTNF